MNLENVKEVSIIGLGSMGSTIAGMYLDAGYKVRVWNRTKDKAAALIARGAQLSEHLTDVLQSSLILICVHDYKAADAIFQNQETDLDLSDKLVVQLTTGSPLNARESEVWFNERGAGYLDGAIQVAPDQMGKPDTTILLSGNADVFQSNMAHLNILGGNITYLGAKVTMAAAMDLATLSYVYGSVIGFMHGALIAEKEGFDLNIFGSIISDMSPNMGEFLKHEAKVIDGGDFSISQSPLSISVEATERILEAAKEAKIDSSFPDFAAHMLNTAAAAGYGNQELAALIKVLRLSA